MYITWHLGVSRDYNYNLIWWHRNSCFCLPCTLFDTKDTSRTVFILQGITYIHINRQHGSVSTPTNTHPTMANIPECTLTERVSRRRPYHSDVRNHLGPRPPPRRSLTKSSSSPGEVFLLLKSVSSSETRTVSPRSNSLPETRSSGS
jgi:hypothetical protein